MQRLLSAICTSWVFAAAAVAAVAADDFSADRRYEPPTISLVTRLFPARVAINRCNGLTLAQCTAADAASGKIACGTRKDDLEICHGTKKLYRGNGEANQSVGPEWREFRLRDGKIEAQWAVIQVVETLTLGAPATDARPLCEGFGATGYSPCEPFERVGALPAPPRDLPSFSRQYSEPELMQILFGVQMMQYCIRGVPALREAAMHAYAQWREPHAELADFLEPKLARSTAEVIATTPTPTPESQEFQQCGQMLTSLERSARPPDPRFATPEKTWAEMKDALARGDLQAARECFANPYDRFGVLFAQLSAADLQEVGKALATFEMKAHGAERSASGIARRADGRTAEISFVKTGQEWHIERMGAAFVSPAR